MSHDASAVTQRKRIRKRDPEKRRERYLRGDFGQRTCEVCGAEYTPTYKEQRTCGRVCGMVLRNMAGPAGCPLLAFMAGKSHPLLACKWKRPTKEKPQRVCRTCGGPVEPKRQYCEPCRVESARRCYRARRSADHAKRRTQRHARSRAKSNGQVYEPVNPNEIFERDHWRCHLCGKKVERSKCAPHPLSPSIDHIVPLSRGGDHVRANLACAHFSCNASKGNRAQGEQLRLIG